VGWNLIKKNEKEDNIMNTKQYKRLMKSVPEWSDWDAKLNGANLINAKLNGPDLTGVNLTGIKTGSRPQKTKKKARNIMKMKIKLKLTTKERELYEGIKHGMDRPGDGWFHEILSQIGWVEGPSANAVLGSLVKKGLVKNEAVKEIGMPTCTWVCLATDETNFE
jgi:hypothetical protein